MRQRFAALLCALALMFGTAAVAAPAADAGTYLRYQCYWIVNGQGFWAEHPYSVWAALKNSGKYCVARY